MGQTCSCVQVVEAPNPNEDPETGRHGSITSCPDPLIYDLVRRSASSTSNFRGQHHLLYRKGKALMEFVDPPNNSSPKKKQTTRLVLRRVKPEHLHQSSLTHIYAIRSPDVQQPEQRPTTTGGNGANATATAAHESSSLGSSSSASASAAASPLEPDLGMDPYMPAQMSPPPRIPVRDWVCVNEELDIYVCDTGLTHAECDSLVQTTEQVCKGHYAAYTYAKQTLGCREFPTLAHACWEPVHRVTHAIWDHFERPLQLDDREPHIVKYDVTKKERQKLDMHTDKSEWTFLIALSDGCGLDYEGGGTYFEALDATVHVQRGHALIFPGKLRHCGQRITKGLRFLLVGFLVDKANPNHHHHHHHAHHHHHHHPNVHHASAPTTATTTTATAVATVAAHSAQALATTTTANATAASATSTTTPSPQTSPTHLMGGSSSKDQDDKSDRDTPATAAAATTTTTTTAVATATATKVATTTKAAVAATTTAGAMTTAAAVTTTTTQAGNAN